ncbi:hypothetical protein [Pseudoruegeria sp. SK021]|uniref:hypothetical protein n=1 Tax=Pseudoruegeria sp. SK021 TaxID=1933035 RepID=UPI000A22CD23|nr:hypothetical protein [Pseudoruegeria sp. SK021]OSP56711.1 hypothetical protein BV911_01815 [Pseudoruegeria sp. SK021]
MNYDSDLEKRILNRLAERENDPEQDDHAFAMTWEAAPEAFGMPHGSDADVSASWEALFTQLEEMQRRRLVSGTVYMNRIADLKLEYRGYAVLRANLEQVFREDHERLLAGYEKLRRDNDALRADQNTAMTEIRNEITALRDAAMAPSVQAPAWGKMMLPAIVLPVLVTVATIAVVHFSGMTPH